MAIRSILVTGGAGYIGSHLVDRLVLRGYDVTVLDNLEPQVHRSGTWPSYANPRAKYVRGDVRDRARFESLVLASDAVVHFGRGRQRGAEHVPGRSVRRCQHAWHRAPARHSRQHAPPRRESAGCIVHRCLRRRRISLRPLRAGCSRESDRPSSWRNGTGSSIALSAGSTWRRFRQRRTSRFIATTSIR